MRSCERSPAAGSSAWRSAAPSCTARPVLFLDEPTSGVEPEARRRFWDLIHDLASEGVTILVSTHYMDEAEYCNRIALIDAGRLVAIGSPGELRQHRAGRHAVRARVLRARRGAGSSATGARCHRCVDLRRQAACAARARRDGADLQPLLTRQGIRRGPPRVHHTEPRGCVRSTRLQAARSASRPHEPPARSSPSPSRRRCRSGATRAASRSRCSCR